LQRLFRLSFLFLEVFGFLVASLCFWRKRKFLGLPRRRFSGPFR
jgi:hypothetical protein